MYSLRLWFLSIIISFLILSQTVSGQSSEQIVISTDREIYFSGEPVWYNLNCLKTGTDQPSYLSKVAYLELLNLNDTPVSQYKVYLREGQNDSRIIIPDTLSTGLYILRVYTNWMKNFGSAVFSGKLISVINPFQRSKFANMDFACSIAGPPVIESQNSNISMGNLQNKYKHRSLVELNVRNESGLKNLSVSVVKKVLTGNSGGGSEYSGKGKWDQISQNGRADLRKYDFQPEIEGEIISGTIKNIKDNSPVINQVLTLSFVGRIPLLYLSKTDSSGRFRFVANQFGVRDLVIQPLSHDTTDMDFSINIEPSFIRSSDSIIVKQREPDDSFIEEINKCIISMQVEALYKLYGNNKETPVAGPPNYSFFGDPENIVTLSHYIELPTMNEVFKEIVPNVNVSDKKNNRKFKVSGTIAGSIKSSFTLVDGIFIKDINRIMVINPEDIKQIDVINLNYFLQDQELGAIISIQTNKGDLSALDFDNRIFRREFTGYHNSYIYSSPDYSIDSILASPMADFRNLLFWNPQVKQDRNGVGMIRFYTSDDSGLYNIIIEGTGPDGKRKRILFPFSVGN
jgi:hypothetical protein